eukprot:TRINITY_DN4421_c0_g1_i1.p2 TRINITY_DN4421_c0_g1~~TRINITY_DN4421_c0_g1_i1.p2  ORF type:complete len:102 (-),score=12.06 TRINITY_DN4421_c0_g1_i1:140-445(-)
MIFGKRVRTFWNARTRWVKDGYEESDGDVLKTGYYVGQKLGETGWKQAGGGVIKDLRTAAELHDGFEDNLHPVKQKKRFWQRIKLFKIQREDKDDSQSHQN